MDNATNYKQATYNMYIYQQACIWVSSLITRKYKTTITAAAKQKNINTAKEYRRYFFFGSTVFVPKRSSWLC